jgi:hypothetical protein
VARLAAVTVDATGLTCRGQSETLLTYLDWQCVP